MKPNVIISTQDERSANLFSLPLVDKSADPWGKREVRNFLSGLYGWMEEDYHEKFEAREPGLHASSLWKVCGRKEILAHKAGVAPDPQGPQLAGNFMTQDEGHALHQLWQDDYLGRYGVLIGQWLCKSCGNVDDGARPAACSACSSKYLIYKEYRIEVKEIGVVGHADGVLQLDGEKVLFEFKTKSPAQFPKITAPHYEFIIQVHAYMKGLGLKKAYIIYYPRGKPCSWSRKGGVWKAGRPSAKGFVVKFNDETWAKIERDVNYYYSARKVINSGTYQVAEGWLDKHAPRACASKTCQLAKICPVVKECFG